MNIKETEKGIRLWFKKLKKYYGEDIEFWYYNTHLINNNNNLVFIKTYKQTNELKSNVSFKKLDFVKGILNKFGFWQKR